jgi:hypothetical protein
MTPRHVLGFLAMPPVAGVLAYFAFPMLQAAELIEGAGGSPSPDAPLAFAAAATMIAGFASVGGALPVVWWLSKRKRIVFSELLFWGAIVGTTALALVMGVYLALGALNGKADQLGEPASLLAVLVFRATGLGCVFGAACALAFWIVGVARLARA